MLNKYSVPKQKSKICTVPTYFRCIDPDNKTIDWKDQFIHYYNNTFTHQGQTQKKDSMHLKFYNGVFTIHSKTKKHAFSILQGLIVFKILAQLRQKVQKVQKVQKKIKNKNILSCWNIGCFSSPPAA